MTLAAQRLSQLEKPDAEASEDRLEQELLAEGVLDHVPSPITDLTPYQNRKPIRVEGTPISQLLILERR